MDEMKHDAQEKDSRMESAETETGGDLTESGGKLPLESSDATSEEHDAETQVNGDNGEEGESVSLRFRKPDTRLRIAGIALAVFVLLVALLIVCMAAGRKNESGGSSDTTESPGAPEESTEGGTGSPEIVDLYRFDPSEIPEGHIGFRPKDLSGEIGTLTNQTALSPDLAALLARFGESGAEAETPAVFSAKQR